MRHVTFIGLGLLFVVLDVFGPPPVVEAQQTKQVYRIGVLDGGSDVPPAFAQFRQGLRELDDTEGDNLLMEYRFAQGQADRLPDLAADLVRLKVDVIVAVFVTPTRAAHQATRSIPIVMIGAADPVGVGLAVSLARPDGNVTGTVSMGDELKAARSVQAATSNKAEATRRWVCAVTKQGDAAAFLVTAYPTDAIKEGYGRSKRALRSGGADAHRLVQRSTTGTRLRGARRRSGPHEGLHRPRDRLREA